MRSKPFTGTGGVGVSILLCLLAVDTTVGAGVALSQTAKAREYEIKAAFLFNFVQFVDWPATAFPADRTPIAIGVLGDDPFGSTLDETVRGEAIDDRRLVVRRSTRAEDLKDCHLVFVSRSEKERVPEILAQLRSGSILTVSEIDGFARRGGVINFYLEGAKVRFEINPVSARRQGLKLSSQLLRLGKIVRG